MCSSTRGVSRNSTFDTFDVSFQRSFTYCWLVYLGIFHTLIALPTNAHLLNHGEKPHVDHRRGPVWPRAGWAQAALVPNINSAKVCGRILARTAVCTAVRIRRMHMHRSEETPKYDFTFLEVRKLVNMDLLTTPK